MAYYHVIATLQGGKPKSIANKTEEQVLVSYVLPYVSAGTIKARWGKKTKSYQVAEMRIYRTERIWDSRTGGKLKNFLKGKHNPFRRFEKQAESLIGTDSWRCFIVMPIQGQKFGSQDEQRVFREYDSRFEALQSLLADFDTVAIRIDREYPLLDVVGRIKAEIRRADFVIVDITDERPSCYFEAGYAEAVGCPIIYVASQESVMFPGNSTKIHFDIHMNVNSFTNQGELAQKV